MQQALAPGSKGAIRAVHVGVAGTVPRPATAQAAAGAAFILALTTEVRGI